ncbi:ribose-phosphate pyrophosphokinase [Ligilactobacillus apodemi DSM 16634 = JCM 16172]|uniref:Ribose-phosphate pyrophosphokinase n=1 Tax=Ligilactobacillus apodemi DSM 16634 = JCM 16172 TaxID=1423724 RepID=A0A0R1TY28_9LACO|nr:ribose-phosphate pyrophosphokinase [Ligilactobacillus apodemi]KRL85140.1 ribose-phosphate pyrophosphokinase [Ligilactobacillus apodemi DSM 16634 = JCM 16172]MCR1902220.1 ribose-phosphate pyrophosphokinase [Ligilactobacillus apodemi]
MEKLQENANIKLFALNSNQALAQKIAAELGIKLCDASVKHFSDGEIQININESVRGDDVFIIQSISDPVNENFMELMVMMDALRRSSAGSINAVIPYYGYARADRKARSREPITAKLLANFITLAGADRVITLDLHAGQLQGFFNIPVDHLFAIYGQAEYFKAKGISEDVVVVAPDHNSVKGARNLADLLKAPIAIVDKRDDTRLDIEHSAIIGDVVGHDCIVFDDMIDTGGKMADAAAALAKAGAKDIYACATHAVFSGNAVEELQDSAYKEVVVTDTIEIPENKQFAKLKVLSSAPIFAKAISLIYHNHSVDSLFNNKD